MLDKRHTHPGGKSLIRSEQQALLWQALQEYPPDDGLWNSRKVARAAKARGADTALRATGEYFLKFDDDDRLTPEFLARTTPILVLK